MLYNLKSTYLKENKLFKEGSEKWKKDNYF